MFFIKNALTFLSYKVAKLLVDGNKHTRLLQHVDTTVIKNVYRTGLSDVFHQKCSYFSIIQSGKVIG
jgi:hypothetical protein